MLSGSQALAFASAVDKLVVMYAAHIDLEDRVLFPLADRILLPVQKMEIAQEMQSRRGREGSGQVAG